MRSDHASFFRLAARARHGGELRRAVVVGFKCYKMRWMRWGQWCGYESSDSDSESDGAMPPLEQQEADPVDLPDLA